MCAPAHHALGPARHRFIADQASSSSNRPLTELGWCCCVGEAIASQHVQEEAQVSWHESNHKRGGSVIALGLKRTWPCRQHTHASKSTVHLIEEHCPSVPAKLCQTDGRTVIHNTGLRPQGGRTRRERRHPCRSCPARGSCHSGPNLRVGRRDPQPWSTTALPLLCVHPRSCPTADPCGVCLPGVRR